jgi:hypothetical protein
MVGFAAAVIRRGCMLVQDGDEQITLFQTRSDSSLGLESFMKIDLDFLNIPPAIWLSITAAVGCMQPALADEVAPGGYITIVRTVPAHNAFRPGDPGQATTVATAREDLIVGGTRALQPLVESVSDAALSGVGGQIAGPSQVGSVATTRGVGGSIHSSSATIGPGVMQTMGGGGGVRHIGSTISNAMAPLGSALSAMQGAK